MTRLNWVKTDSFEYSNVSHGVLYLENSKGYSWSGLISVNEKSKTTLSSIYYEGSGFGVLDNLEPFGLDLTSFFYPETFEKFIGEAGNLTNQKRSSFGFSYLVGSLESGELHIVYNCIVLSDERIYLSLNNKSSPLVFSWEFISSPELLYGIRPTSHFVIQLDKVPPNTASALKDRLYGSNTTEASLPTIQGLIQIYEDTAPFQIIDNGDGTWTVRGDSISVIEIDGTTAQLTRGTVVAMDSTRYRLSTEY